MRYLLMVVCVLFVCSDSYGQSCAGSLATPSCGASVRSTPVRDIFASKPLRGIFSKIGSRATASCGQTQAASCAGSMAAPSCAGSLVAPSTPAPQAGCNCGCQTGSACTCNSTPPQKAAVDCPTGTCSIAESRAFATPVRSFVSSGYQQALASAQYRAANRIHGHCSLDTHRTSGVGWASADSTPNTCLGRGGVNYAVVRGADGWYATKFN